jgi:hypothetical protein
MDKIWMVITDDPWPDKYIPVFVGPNHLHIKPEGNVNNYKLFNRERNAISYANHLRQKYGVKHLRIFYLGSYSKKIRS